MSFWQNCHRFILLFFPNDRKSSHIRCVCFSVNCRFLYFFILCSSTLLLLRLWLDPGESLLCGDRRGCGRMERAAQQAGSQRWSHPPQRAANAHRWGAGEENAATEQEQPWGFTAEPMGTHHTTLQIVSGFKPSPASMTHQNHLLRLLFLLCEALGREVSD